MGGASTRPVADLDQISIDLDGYRSLWISMDLDLDGSLSRWISISTSISTSISPERLAALDDQVVPDHVVGRLARQVHDGGLQVGDLAQLTDWHVLYPPGLWVGVGAGALVGVEVGLGLVGMSSTHLG